MDKKINKYVLIFNLIWYSIVVFTGIYLKIKYNWNLALTVIIIAGFEVLGTYLFRMITGIRD